MFFVKMTTLVLIIKVPYPEFLRMKKRKALALYV